MNRNNTQYVDFLVRVEATDAPVITDQSIEQLRDSVFWSLENDRLNNLLRFDDAPYEAIDSVTVTRPVTIDLVLFCPECHKQHIDAPDLEPCKDGCQYAKDVQQAPEHSCAERCLYLEPGSEAVRWTNPPHKSHLCHFCGIVWRPADYATNGVAQIKTRGESDTWPRERKTGTAPIFATGGTVIGKSFVPGHDVAETIIAGEVTFVAGDAVNRSFAEAFAPHVEGRRYTGLELVPTPPVSWSTAPPVVEGTYFFRPLNGPVDQAAVMRVFYCSSSDALCAESQLDRLTHQPIRFVVEVLKGEWCLAHGDKNLLTGDR